MELHKRKIIMVNSILILFLLIIQVQFCFSKGIDSSFYKNISSIYYSYLPDLNLVNDSLYFNGYLIFKISKKPDEGIYKTTNKTFMCEIYWVNNIEKFEQKSEQYIYVSTIQSLMAGKMAYLSEEGRYEKTSSAKKFKDFYYQFDNSKISAFFFFFLRTNIFADTTFFWNYQNNDSVGYFIFKNSFDAALLKTTLTYINEDTKKKGKIKNAKILIPISEAYTFKPVSNKFLIKNGFRKSKWYPQF